MVKNVKLLNYRIGFASNSSSLHSTWHVEDPAAVKEEIEDMNFGWETFVCSTKEGIRKYLAAQLINCLHKRIPNIYLLALVKYLYPEIPEEEYYYRGRWNKCADFQASVDHQSGFTLPHDYTYTNVFLPSIDFLKDLEKYLIDTKCVIVGGNDNEDMVDIDTIIPKEQTKTRNYLLRNFIEISSTKNLVCVKDDKVWKLFNSKNGMKIRFSFEDNIKYDKSSTPELVDLIITNNCNMGCPFCYRGCTPEGKHASMENIATLLFVLSGNGVKCFEVAIGGGDILNYPKLEKLCKLIKENDSYYTYGRMVYNTTLNCKDFTEENLEKIKLVCDSFRGLAISIRTVEDMISVLEYIKQHNLAENEYSFQCIPELMSYDDLIGIIDYRGTTQQVEYTLTFLGFKPTGRGCSIPAAEIEKNREQFNKVIDYLHEKIGHWYTYGIDTQLLANFPKLKETLADWEYTENEGKFSCCIDAVDGYILPSSYSEYKEEYKIPKKKELGDSKSEITEVFDRHKIDDFIINTYQKF